METDEVIDSQCEKGTVDLYPTFATTVNDSDDLSRCDKTQLLHVISKEQVTIYNLTTTIESLEPEIHNLLTQLDSKQTHNFDQDSVLENNFPPIKKRRKIQKSSKQATLFTFNANRFVLLNIDKNIAAKPQAETENDDPLMESTTTLYKSKTIQNQTPRKKW